MIVRASWCPSSASRHLSENPSTFLPPSGSASSPCSSHRSTPVSIRATRARRKILDAIHEGHLEATFVTVRRGGSRIECWIRRDSLNRWIVARDAELARYMPRPEAERALGLKNVTISRVSAAYGPPASPCKPSDSVQPAKRQPGRARLGVPDVAPGRIPEAHGTRTRWPAGPARLCACRTQMRNSRDVVLADDGGQIRE